MSQALARRSSAAARFSGRDRLIVRSLTLRVYWERIGVLGPIYRLVGLGFNDRQIASRLNISEVKVRGCVAWLLKFLNMPDRLDLVGHAHTTEGPARQPLVEAEPGYVPVMSWAD